MLSAPTSTAPAASSRAISVASRAAGAHSRLILEPASVGSPATSNRFLTANGTPASGPSSRPSSRALSITRALASARSPSTAVKALSTGLSAAMRARATRTTALALVRPSRTAAAISVAYAQAVSIRPVLGQKDRGRFGIVGQGKVCERGGKSKCRREIGLDRAFPRRLDFKIERARRSLDKVVERIARCLLGAPELSFAAHARRGGSARLFGLVFAQRFGS